MKSCVQFAPSAVLFFLFEKLKPTKNAPDRVIQILGVVIEQNEIHEKETTKPARKERRKEVTSALWEDHFRNDRPEKKQQKISAKGSEDKADNAAQKSDGIEDAPFRAASMLGQPASAAALQARWTADWAGLALEQQTSGKQTQMILWQHACGGWNAKKTEFVSGSVLCNAF
jgi:hypothetical protein